MTFPIKRSWNDLEWKIEGPKTIECGSFIDATLGDSIGQGTILKTQVREL